MAGLVTDGTSPLSDGTPSELRELAKDAIDRNDRWILGRGDGIEQSQAAALARGLLSALDALEAANRQHDYLMLVAKRDIEAAEASRDQAIKERDRCGDTARETIKDALLLKERAEAERDRLVEALREIDTSSPLPDHFDPAEWWKHVASKRREIARSALAGVPGGSPEEQEEEREYVLDDGLGPDMRYGKRPGGGAER